MMNYNKKDKIKKQQKKIFAIEITGNTVKKTTKQNKPRQCSVEI